jgi:hypothetical protein
VQKLDPAFILRDTGIALPGGLYRLAHDSTLTRLQLLRNKAVAGDFSDFESIVQVLPNATASQLQLPRVWTGRWLTFGSSYTVATVDSFDNLSLFVEAGSGRLAFADSGVARILAHTVDTVNHRISSATPAFELRDTDQALPNGLWRIRQDELKVRIERNTAAGGDFSTDQDHMNIINNPTGNEVAVEIFGTMTLFSLGTAGSPAVRFEDAVTAVNATPKSIYRNSVDSRPHWTTTAHVFPGGPADERVIAFHEDMVVRETPSGAVDGVNVTFTLAFTPVTGKEQVYLNGILQDAGATNDYTISGVTITYNTAPVSGDKLRVSYIYKS